MSCLRWIVGGDGSRASSSAEDGGPKMGAHGAGRAACHAFLAGVGGEAATRTFPSMQNRRVLRLPPRFPFFRLENCCFSQVLVTFYLFIPPHATVEICSFCRKKNRITPPSPCTPPPAPLKCVLPCCVASRTVLCCRDLPQVTG